MRDLARLMGLDRCPTFYADRFFLAALIAGGAFWLVLGMAGATHPLGVDQILSWSFLSLAVWHPLLEELLFRGVIQGRLTEHQWGRRAFRGVTVANGITSLLFVLAHWWTHPVLWACLVLVPSFLIGFVRDRFSSLYPAIALHAVYNAGYFALTGLP